MTVAVRSATASVDDDEVSGAGVLDELQDARTRMALNAIAARIGVETRIVFRSSARQRRRAHDSRMRTSRFACASTDVFELCSTRDGVSRNLQVAPNEREIRVIARLFLVTIDLSQILAR